MIDWNKTTRKEMLLINQIAKLAVRLAPLLDFLQVQMDLEACHRNGCKLDLAGLATADHYSLMHDALGIRRHIDRDTGQLNESFCLRYAV